MQVRPLQSSIVKPNDDLFAIIDEVISNDPQLKGQLTNGCVLAISSKIISYCQGCLVAKQRSEDKGFSREEARDEKHALVQKEAELYINPHSSKYDLMLTIKDSTLAVNAGIDESNASLDGNQCFVLWPTKIQETINQIWQHLRVKHQLTNFGVITTDSRSFPLRWGVVGTTLAYCGFRGLNNHIGEKDIFGREIHMVQVNVAEALGVSATFEMGEVDETTPFALLTDLNKVQFVDHEPDQEELEKSKITIEDDAYAPLFVNAAWQKGGSHHDE